MHCERVFCYQALPLYRGIYRKMGNKDGLKVPMLTPSKRGSCGDGCVRVFRISHPSTNQAYPCLASEVRLGQGGIELGERQLELFHSLVSCFGHIHTTCRFFLQQAPT